MPPHRENWTETFGQNNQIGVHEPVEDARASMRLFVSVREEFEAPLERGEDLQGFQGRWGIISHKAHDQIVCPVVLVVSCIQVSPKTFVVLEPGRSWRLVAFSPQRKENFLHPREIRPTRDRRTDSFGFYDQLHITLFTHGNSPNRSNP